MTAREIAERYGEAGEHDALELMILRYIELHSHNATIAEREACAKIAEKNKIQLGSPSIEEVARRIAASIRYRSIDV